MWPPPKRRRPWEWMKGLVSLALLTFVLSTCSFMQRQETKINSNVDHATKILTLSNDSTSFLSARVFAIRFNINFISDAQGHLAIDGKKPISHMYTNGWISDWIRLFPLLGSRSFDLAQKLEFEEMDFEKYDPSNLYCLVIEARNWLTNGATLSATLTPKVKFSANAFGQIDATRSLIGGGYDALKDHLMHQTLIRSDCLALYELAR